MQRSAPWKRALRSPVAGATWGEPTRGVASGDLPFLDCLYGSGASKSAPLEGILSQQKHSHFSGLKRAGSAPSRSGRGDDGQGGELDRTELGADRNPSPWSIGAHRENLPAVQHHPPQIPLHGEGRVVRLADQHRERNRSAESSPPAALSLETLDRAFSGAEMEREESRGGPEIGVDDRPPRRRERAGLQHLEGGPQTRRGNRPGQHGDSLGASGGTQRSGRPSKAMQCPLAVEGCPSRLSSPHEPQTQGLEDQRTLRAGARREARAVRAGAARAREADPWPCARPARPSSHCAPG